MAYPVECTLAYVAEDPATHEVRQSIFRCGSVSFAPNPDYQGRRIVFFESKVQQEESVRKGGGMMIVPNDVLTQADEDNVKRIVRDVLREYGLLPATDEINATSQAIGLAMDHGLDLTDVTGTGEGGKITKGDVEKALALSHVLDEEPPA